MLLRGAAQHQYGDRVAQHLGGNLVGHRVRHGHRDRSIDVDDLAPCALMREERDPGTCTEGGDPGAYFGNHPGRFESSNQLEAGGLRNRHGQQVTGVDRERADPYLHLTGSRRLRFSDIGDPEYFGRLTAAAVGDCQVHAYGSLVFG